MRGITRITSSTTASSDAVQVEREGRVVRGGIYGAVLLVGALAAFAPAGLRARRPRLVSVAYAANLGALAVLGLAFMPGLLLGSWLISRPLRRMPLPGE